MNCNSEICPADQNNLFAPFVGSSQDNTDNTNSTNTATSSQSTSGSQSTTVNCNDDRGAEP